MMIKKLFIHLEKPGQFSYINTNKKKKHGYGTHEHIKITVFKYNLERDNTNG